MQLRRHSTLWRIILFLLLKESKFQTTMGSHCRLGAPLSFRWILCQANQALKVHCHPVLVAVLSKTSWNLDKNIQILNSTAFKLPSPWKLDHLKSNLQKVQILNGQISSVFWKHFHWHISLRRIYSKGSKSICIHILHVRACSVYDPDHSKTEQFKMSPGLDHFLYLKCYFSSYETV